MATGRRLTLFVLLGIVLAVGVTASVLLLGGAAGSAGTPAGGKGALEASMSQVEEPTEAFANALLDCSVAISGGHAGELTDCFTEQVFATPFPAEPSPGQRAAKWFHSRSWPLPPAVRMSRERMVASLEVFLDRFMEIEDVRLKVKSSQLVAGQVVEAEVKLWLVGRNIDGKREWVRGEAMASGLQEGDRWRLKRLELLSLGSLWAERDFFTEMGGAAGLEALDPPVLEHATLGLAAYGAAAGDLDGDGLLDIFSTGARKNSLYLNQGDGTFADVAEDAWISALPSPGTAPLLFDLDNDGDLDVFISSNGEQYLFENRLVPDGTLRFRDVSAQAGVDRRTVAFSATAADVNRDGFVDLYVAAYNNYGKILPDRWDAAGNGLPNLLFINDGDGTFTEAARQWGVADSRWSYAASFVDVDMDGRPDLYVANDFGGGNSLYLNKEDHFIDTAAGWGVRDDGYGMGVSFADYDNDGDFDLHVTRMSSTAGRRILARLAGVLDEREELESLASGNALYRNEGFGLFREVSGEAGPFPAGWAWGGGFVDLDNDGWEDLHTPNGFLSGASMKDT